jgi:hypothetical protein
MGARRACGTEEPDSQYNQQPLIIVCVPSYLLEAWKIPKNQLKLEKTNSLASLSQEYYEMLFECPVVLGRKLSS